MRLILYILAFALSGCAYSYAGQDGKSRDESSKKQDVKIVEVKPAENPQETEPEPVTNLDPDSKCGIARFSIHFIEETATREKVIDCETKAVVETKQPGPANYEQAVASNLPTKTWYFLVDPHGAGATELNNDHLIKLSRQFEIEFFGRHQTKNLLIYTFLEKI